MTARLIRPLPCGSLGRPRCYILHIRTSTAHACAYTYIFVVVVASAASLFGNDEDRLTSKETKRPAGRPGRRRRSHHISHMQTGKKENAFLGMGDVDGN